MSANMLSQLSNVLPTGTFLVFQILAPLATNNGNCGKVEVVLTGVTLSLLCLLCVASAFSDSVEGPDGVVYYGFVTYKGLWNPNFRRVFKQVPPGAPAGTQPGSFYIDPANKYKWEFDDFVSAAVSVLALATISLLTAPVTTCFYPHITDSILKTVPVLVALVVAAICAFGNTPRNGLGFTAVTKTKAASEEPTHETTASDSQPRHPEQLGTGNQHV